MQDLINLKPSHNLISLKDVTFKKENDFEGLVELYIMSNNLLEVEDDDGDGNHLTIIVKRIDLTFNDKEC